LAKYAAFNCNLGGAFLNLDLLFDPRRLLKIENMPLAKFCQMARKL
jgi:hypothetical protein